MTSHHDCLNAATTICADLKRLWNTGDTLTDLALAALAITLTATLILVARLARPTPSE